ncbi:hypothetical protein Tco_0051124 [Tanacetum coccineum]
MLEKGGYDTWQRRMLLYTERKENGQMLLDLIFSGPFQFQEITIPANEETGRAIEKRMQTLTDLTPEENTRMGCKSDKMLTLPRYLCITLSLTNYTITCNSKNYDSTNEETGRAIEKRMQTLTDLTPEENTRMGCDIKAANIILQGLLNDICTLINHKTKAYGSGIKFEKLMNVINIIGLNMTKLQVDTKFANHLRPEWSKFIIGVKQARNLHEVSFDNLYAYLKQNEADASEVRAMRARFLDPLALVAHTYNSPTSNAGRPSQYNP